MNTRIILISLFLVFIFIGGNASEREPVAVSPGSEVGVAVVGQDCPTFSWTAVSWAAGYKVVVFEAVSTEVLTYEEIEAMVSPVLNKEIRGPALSWTPSGDERLMNGGEYVWYVQAVDESGIGVWSEGRIFKVEVAVRLAGVEEKLRERLREYGLSEEVITEVFEDVKTEVKEVVIRGSDTKGSPGAIGIQGNETGSNTWYGENAAVSITTGTYNSFFGQRAGYSNTEGGHNTFIGFEAGYANTTAYQNTFIGYYAGRSNSTGYDNTFIGSYAGRYNTTGYRNTFIGSYAGRNNSTGSYNTFLGWYTGEKNTTGYENTFIGHGAGRFNTTGYYNTFIGRDTGYNNETGQGNIFLGYSAGYNETGSNKLYIDNSDTGSPLIYGEFDNDILTINGKVGIGTNTPATHLELQKAGENPSFQVNRSDSGARMRVTASSVAGLITSSGAIRFRTSNSTRMTIGEDGDIGIGVYNPSYLLHLAGGAYCDGGAWIAGSSREYKENITSLNTKEALEALEGLNPVRFNYKKNAEEDYVGFIAEDVPELVATKNRKGINTMDVVAVLTKVVKEHRETNKKQEKIIEKLLERIEALEKKK